MDYAQTATGRLSFSQLGRTLIHEHIHVGMPGWQFDHGAPKYVRAELMARSVDKLQELQAYGCSTIVDPCPIDLGRDVEFVAEAAQRSGTNIIVATGVYYEADGITCTFRMLEREQILELYLKELTEGVGDSGIKAGVVKIASGEHANNAYETRMVGIGAEAARLTGVPLISHTHYASHGHHQLDVVEQNGGCPGCTVVGHSGDRDDHDYQRSLAERGAFVGLDRFGMEMFLPDDIRIRNLVQLFEAGFRDNILVSHDHVLCVLGRLGAEYEGRVPTSRLTRIFDYVLPQLKRFGLSDADIECILVDNPRQLFVNAAAQTAQVVQLSESASSA
jgi:phosphotriesterase-related protein